jgi:hypothetical protein
VKIR